MKGWFYRFSFAFTLGILQVDIQRRKLYNDIMRKATINEARRCPICGKAENQVNAGKNRTGTQQCFCNDCKKYYTLEPKTREYQR